MICEVRRFLRAHLPPNARVICAVSGGPDSMALLRAVLTLRDELGCSLSCAHFNHLLRGAESDADEALVRTFCAQNGIPFHAGRGDAAAAAAQSGESLEEAARRLRYAFLLSLDPDAFLLTAHTADDNLETMLMHLVRGASLRGLSGIPPVRGQVLRPMLTVTRAQVLDFLAETDTPHRQDSSNDADDHLRNRIRHHVVPLLTRENPSLAVSAQRAAARLREEDALLDRLAAKALADAAQPDGLSCAALREQPMPLLRRAVHLHLQAAELPELAARHIESVCALILGSDPAAGVDLPGGLRAERRYDTLCLCPAAPAGSFPPTVLQIPGVTAIPALGLQISCQVAQTQDFDTIPCDFAVHYSGGEITVRPRATGDTMRLSGGSRSLKKLMIDRKIPAAQRARVPVFADASGVLAVCGIGANLDRLPRAGESALYIQIEKEEFRNEHP